MHKPNFGFIGIVLVSIIAMALAEWKPVDQRDGTFVDPYDETTVTLPDSVIYVIRSAVPLNGGRMKVQYDTVHKFWTISCE